MQPADRLEARSLLLDEVYLQLDRTRQLHTAEKKRADAAEAKVVELERERDALKGEPIEPHT